ncbi:PE domain-containing protein [Nocardia tengchongensis]|uniref:PE domain-containing protein n=1 Tax=Nocardia tengchongensis TaxID=2055889 RepID=UPI0036B9C354
MSLEVVPEELPVIGAQIDVTRASLTTVLGAAMPLTKPVPAGGDIVSLYVSGVMALFGEQFFPITTVPGVSQMEPGTAALVQSAAEYAAGDVSGGGQVTASGLAV